MQVGIFTVPEGLEFPQSYAHVRHDMRAFARSIDMKLEFVHRKKSGTSYCNVTSREAKVVESLAGRQEDIPVLIHTALHECSHFIDCHNGLFGNFYPYGEGSFHVLPLEEDYTRLALRAERHADWLADKIMLAMYEQTRDWKSFYDYHGLAREYLLKTKFEDDRPGDPDVLDFHIV